MIDLPVVIKNKGSGFFKNSIELYNPNEIVRSLCTETGLCEDMSLIISEAVSRKIIASNVKFLTGPMIREFVCCELLYNGHEKERAKYTSPRIPFYDFDLLVSNGHTLQEIKDHIYNEMNSQYLGLKNIYKNL